MPTTMQNRVTIDDIPGMPSGEIATLPPDQLVLLANEAAANGGRALLARHADRIREVEMPDDAVLIDVDQPSDLAALLADPAPGQSG